MDGVISLRMELYTFGMELYPSDGVISLWDGVISLRMELIFRMETKKGVPENWHTLRDDYVFVFLFFWKGLLVVFNGAWHLHFTSHHGCLAADPVALVVEFVVGVRDFHVLSAHVHRC